MLPVEYETGRARIGVEFDHPLCRGDLDGIDQRIEEIEARTGRSRDSRIRISIYEFGGGISCPGSPFGCYFNEQDAIATLSFALDHELVHAVAPERFLPNRFWSEGLADAYNGEGTRNAGTPVLDTYESNSPEYDVAAHFVRWITETRGVEAIQRIIAGDSIGEATGSTLEELALEFDSSAPFAYPDWEICPYPEVEESAEGEWTEEFDFDCDTPGSRALVAGFGATQSRSVALEKGRYRVLLSGNAESFGVLGCQTEVLASKPGPDIVDGELNYWHGSVLSEVQFSRTALPRVLEPNVEHELDLEVGLYQVEISAFVDEPFVGSLSISRLDE